MKSLFPALIALVFTVAPTSAQLLDRIETGVLNCQVAAGVGWLVGSKKGLSCSFRPGGGGGQTQYYTGSLEKVGLDIGYTEKSYISWVVLAVTDHIPDGNLAGVYRGASAQASVGIGVGANALIGGNRDSYILQPLSGQTQTGLNLAVGVASLELRQR